MDEFKPEDELKPDPSDRPARNRKPNGDNEPQINFDDFDLDEDDTRPTRSRRGREHDEVDSEEARSETASRRPCKRKGAPQGPISRQHLMMALGILVLLLLIFGIGSALNTPTTVNAPGTDDRSAGRSIDLSGNSETAANQANGAQPQPGTTSAANPAAPQEITLPEVSSTPTQGQVSPGPDNQQRVEVQGNLNNALTQQQGQFDNAAGKTTLPTEPATVAPVNGSSAPRQAAKNDRAASNKTTPANERQRAVIEPTRKTESNRSRPQAPAASSGTKATATRPAAPAASAAAPKTSSSSPAATGNIGMLTSAPGNHYTLQLSSSSNYNNLNAWAKKEKLNNAVIYKTTRNGQPWYVLVNGVYASRDEARRAVTSLPADVQAKNPWTKPINQVQADLKQ